MCHSSKPSTGVENPFPYSGHPEKKVILQNCVFQCTCRAGRLCRTYVRVDRCTVVTGNTVTFALQTRCVVQRWLFMCR